MVQPSAPPPFMIMKFPIYARAWIGQSVHDIVGVGPGRIIMRNGAYPAKA